MNAIADPWLLTYLGRMALFLIDPYQDGCTLLDAFAFNASFYGIPIGLILGWFGESLWTPITFGAAPVVGAATQNSRKLCSDRTAALG